MAKKQLLSVTISCIEGLPISSNAGQIQVRYGTKSVVSSVKSPLRTGHSSDIMEAFTFPLEGLAIQFDVFHIEGNSLPNICSGGLVISGKPDYTFDGPINLLDKTGGRCPEAKMYVSVTVAQC